MRYRYLLASMPFLVAFDNPPSWLTAEKLVNPDSTFTLPESPEVGYACYSQGSDNYTVKGDLDVLDDIGANPADWPAILESALLPTDACDAALCHGSQQEIDSACGSEPPPPPPPPPPPADFKLSNYSVESFVPTGPDASGIAVLPDGNLMITRQTILEIRSPEGELLESRSSEGNDLEGLEFFDGLVLGINESPGFHVRYDVNGALLDYKALSFSNGECIAVHEGKVYYGVEAAGLIGDAQQNIYIDLGRDVSACTSAGGYFIAITSNPWRQSTIYRIDTATWKVVESLPLPTCDCEGVAFSHDLSRMYIVQEPSRGGGGGLTIYTRD